MSIEGYKVFNRDWTCRDFQYAVGKTYKLKPTSFGNIKTRPMEICHWGFHFCNNIESCFEFYQFVPSVKIAKVVSGPNIDYEILWDFEGIKYCTDEISIVEEISILDFINNSSNGIFPYLTLTKCYSYNYDLWNIFIKEHSLKSFFESQLNYPRTAYLNNYLNDISRLILT